MDDVIDLPSYSFWRFTEGILLLSEQQRCQQQMLIASLGMCLEGTLKVGLYSLDLK